jgi:predicted hydrocarbon binding protein
MSIFDKLAAIKEVKFDDGSITLSGQRVLIIPQELAQATTAQMVKNPKLGGAIYEETRKAVAKGWAELVKRRYKFGDDPRKFIQWLIETGEFVGWGKHELIKFESSKLEGIMRTHNAPMAEMFKGKTKKPIDHIWRALTAGCSTAAFDTDMDWVEINCLANGGQYCDFLFKPRKSFTAKEKKEYKDQLP